MFLKRFLLFMVLISTLILPAFVSAEVLWDQPLSSVNTSPYFNQVFIPVSDSDSFLADDFVNTETWDISTIFVPGKFWHQGTSPSLQNAAALMWWIYTDSGGVPIGYANVGKNTWYLGLEPSDPQVTITTGSGGLPSDVILNLSTPIRILPGHYWLVFTPGANYSDVGAHGRQPSDTINGYPAQYIQPDGGTAGLPTVWTSVLNIDWTAFNFPQLTQQDFAFRIEGTKIAGNIVVTPGSIDFGDVLLGQASSAQTVTISNTGTSALAINTITITGDDASAFSLAGGTCGAAFPVNLASAESCTQNVTFTPSDASGQSATLEVASDDPNDGLVMVSLSGTGAEDVVQPSVTEGTVGSEITFTAGPSISFGDKKGKVVIGTGKTTSNLKIAKNGWSNTSITCTVNKALPADVYDVTITLQPYRDKVSIDLPGAFTFMKPEVYALTVDNGVRGDLITLNGKFFGIKKPKVYLDYLDSKGNAKKKNCPVKSVIAWDETTGASSIQFKVPGGIAAGTYPLSVETKGVGTSVEDISFTIN